MRYLSLCLMNAAAGTALWLVLDLIERGPQSISHYIAVFTGMVVGAVTIKNTAALFPTMK